MRKALLASVAIAIGSLASVATASPKCNVDPLFNQLHVILANKTVSEFRDALANDADYRALLGDVAFLGENTTFPFINLAFPPLDDPVLVVDRLNRSGEFTTVYVGGRICFLGPPDAVSTAIEYYNTALDHYFFTADANEQQAIDAGLVGPNWVRTGKSFKVSTIYYGCSVTESGLHPVYRFAGEPNIGPNSHFITASVDECAVVRDRTDWHWMFEGAPFYASEPIAGACPAGFYRYPQPLYRAYNNGMGGDPNHRYSTDHAVIDAMVAQGWVDEGVAMCVTAP